MQKSEFIENASLSELMEFNSMIKEEIAHRQETAKDELLNEIREKSKALGLTNEDLTEALQKMKPSKAPQKYRNPLNAQETWTGRGRKPKWLSLQLGEGRTLDEFAI